MIVTDCNIISYYFIPGKYTNLVQKLFLKEHHWIAPSLWRSEFRNVLSLYLRKKIIDLDFALMIFEKADILLTNNEFKIDSSKVLQLAKESDCSAYDCEYVSLAYDFNVPLITMDKKILMSFPKIALSIKDFIKQK